LAFTLGGAVVHNSASDGTATYNRCSTIAVNLPCIVCTKSCSNATGQNGSITFSGSVSNCGNSQLVNVIASNLVNGVLTQLTLSTNVLNPGQVATYAGS